jgi:exportin-1
MIGSLSFLICLFCQVAVSLNPSGAVISPESLAAANVIFVQNFVAEVLHNAFPHLTQLQIKVTVEGLFNLDQDITGFREHLRDFLVQIKVCPR